MKVLMSHLGELVLSVVVVTLVFLLLFGTSQDGMLYRMDGILPEVETPYTSTWDAGAFHKVLSTPKPDIGMYGVKPDGTINTVYSQTDYTADSLFYATDADGTALDVVAESVSRFPGGEDLADIQPARGIRFPNAGIYEVKLVVTDNTDRIWKKTIRIPVRKG